MEISEYRCDHVVLHLPLDEQHSSEHVEAFQSDSSASRKEASC